MSLKKILAVLFLVLVVGFASGQEKKIHLPDILGYHTLKCDFHMHTVFSDGLVWPTFRVEEAWREGLDAISITDHIEYTPHSSDVPVNHNRPYGIAQSLAKEKNILLIRGAEVTRDMPPGHLNVLFIEDANTLVDEDVFEVLKNAREQGAFIQWNHPGWKAQAPDSTIWWDEHTSLYENGLLHGIEVFNYHSYYPEAIDWAVEKDLTVMANSDIHSTTDYDGVIQNNHRPLTLVFAESRTEEGIKDALFDQRTIAWFGNTLMGNAALLEPFFFASVDISDVPLSLNKGEVKYIHFKNNTDVDYELELVRGSDSFSAPEEIVLKARQNTPLQLTGTKEKVKNFKELELSYRVKNMWMNSTQQLIVSFSFKNHK